jgi:hypothetical protein
MHTYIYTHTHTHTYNYPCSHADGFLVSAGSGVITLGLPDSPGVPKAAAAPTLTAQYNDLASVEALLKANKVLNDVLHICNTFYTAALKNPPFLS